MSWTRTGVAPFDTSEIRLAGVLRPQEARRSDGLPVQGLFIETTGGAVVFFRIATTGIRVLLLTRVLHAAALLVLAGTRRGIALLLLPSLVLATQSAGLIIPIALRTARELLLRLRHNRFSAAPIHRFQDGVEPP